MAAGLLRLRRRPDYKPAYRLWGSPLVPFIFIAASLVVVVMQMTTAPKGSLLGLGMVAAGLPVYFFWSSRERRT